MPNATLDDEFDDRPTTQAWSAWIFNNYIVRGIAGGCAFLACLLSALLVREHLRQYRKPRRQRYIIRIIMMVRPMADVNPLSPLF